MKCEYGCGQEAKFQLKNGKWCCESSSNKCKEIRRKNAEKQLGNQNGKFAKHTYKKCCFCQNDISATWFERHKETCLQNPENIRKLEERKNTFDKICEQCGKAHNGLYGKGRFCCEKCAKSFATGNENDFKKFLKCTSCGIELSRTKRASGFNVKCEECKKERIKIYRKLKQLEKEKTINRKEKKEKIKNNCRICNLEIKNKNKTGLCKKCLSKDPEYRKKLSEINKGKCGGYRNNPGFGHSGWYSGIFCQSSWELAWVIYNLEHEIKFERNKQGFEYEFNGEKHKFYPDFKLENGTFVEIKGRKDEQTISKMEQFKEKLIIIERHDIKKYLEYVNKKYGNDFIKLYKNN